MSATLEPSFEYVTARGRGAPAGLSSRLPNAGLYRRLARANLRAVVDNAFPVAVSVLGEEGWGDLFDRFLEAGGPTTSLYRDVPGDLVVWAAEAGHPYADLLHYEWLELLAARAVAPASGTDASTPGGRALRPNPTLQVGVYERPVERISASNPTPAPFDVPHVYLVWRRPTSDEVCFHRMGLTLGQIVARVALEGAEPAVLAREVAQAAGWEPAALLARVREALDALTRREGLA